MLVLFNAFAKTSLVASAFCIALFACRPLTRRVFSATWHYGVSLILVLLLVVPLPLLFTSLKIIPHMAEKVASATALLVGAGTEGQMWWEITQPLQVGQVSYLGLTRRLLSQLHALWFMGVLAALVFRVSAYKRFRSTVLSRNAGIAQSDTLGLLEMCKAELGIRRPVEVVYNDLIGSPMLTGWLRPVIMLPSTAVPLDDLRYIFLHELVHLKRGDLWFKAATLVAKVLHWFNPICYLLVKNVHRLCELSCDEAVVSSMDFSARKRYAATILATLSGACLPRGVYSALGGNKEEIKRRLAHMLNYTSAKKSHVFLAAVIALMLSVTGIVAATTTLAPAAEAITHSPTALLWPVPSSSIIASRFGVRVHPVSKEEVRHTGIDIPAQAGESILAAAGGKVLVAEYIEAYGNTILLDHGEGITSLYAHCSKLLVNAEDEVAVGAEIARVGSTGYATGPHLHFEVQRNGEPQNPLDYLN